MNETPTEIHELTERVLAAWAEALDIDVEAVPLDVSFFEAGGNSLLLLLLSEHLNELTTRELTIGELFQHSTVRAQTALLTDAPDAPAARLGATTRHTLLGRAGGAR
ncbi:phosphopantetheine-binding protein [Actinophytocola sp.]|uniref:phosphopantetheine-binding protein n=1 Tax=Actinophytocola sp. TaxID=1872138 RepID=UPI002ED271EC